MRSTIFVLLGLTWGVPCAVAAQVSFEFLPYVGVYLPTQNLLDHFQSVWCNCSLKQETRVALGGRLTLWRTSGVGAEVTLGYSPSGVSTVGSQPPESSAHDRLAGTPSVLGNPTVIPGVGVTHLRYAIRQA